MILQNLIDEQGATNVVSLWKGATNHESLRTTALDRFRNVVFLLGVKSTRLYMPDRDEWSCIFHSPTPLLFLG